MLSLPFFAFSRFLPSIGLWCLLVLGSQSFAQDTYRTRRANLDPLVNKNVWNLGVAELEGVFKQDAVMRWMSEEKDKANLTKKPYSNVTQELSLCNGALSADEAIIDMKEGKVSAVTVSLYNRGDSAPMDKGPYKALLEKARSALDAHFAVKGEDTGRDKNSAVKAQGILWKPEGLMALLEFSATDDKGVFMAQFVRLRLLPPVAKAGLGTAPAKNTATVTRAQLAKNVVRSADGNVYLDVPMVDQGQKGYCLIASCERVFRYFGIQCDQHELAQLAGTGVAGGTSVSGMEEALQRLDGRFKFRFKRVYHLAWDDFLKRVGDYNRVARKADKPQYTEQEARSYGWDLDEKMDAACLRTAATQSSEYRRFLKQVKESINSGTPLLWSLKLGLFPEPGRMNQSTGNHMRLIVGYNEKDPATPTILFSDSWGAGHECKPMPAADAFAATHSAHTMEPTVAK